LHKARGVRQQGAKLGANKSADSMERVRGMKLAKEADEMKLKSEERISYLLKGLNRDSRTDERQLRRTLAQSRDRR